MSFKASSCINSSTVAGEGYFTIPAEKMNSFTGICQGVFQILGLHNFKEEKRRRFHEYTV